MDYGRTKYYPKLIDIQQKKKEVEKLVSDGHEVMIEHNIAPNTEVAEAVVLMLIGFILVYVLEKISAKKA